MKIIKTVFFSCSIGIFAIFLSLGNLFRLVESSLFSDSLMVSEAVLYISVLLSALFLRSYTKLLFKAAPWIVGIFCSFIYGLLLHGGDIHAILYALRLIAIILTICVLSEIFFEVYKGSIQAFFSYLCKAYSVSLFLGFALYLFFPDSEKLWLW
ncbi:MAG: hypothetical protein JSS09_08605, partial [Verrucomicrobia bacterium]|nr:hypothetical protein [Verrucomicrobiota bacterium]